jgi:methylmalonyl-CoA/ethylmalonyl-CoA epimerase
MTQSSSPSAPPAPTASLAGLVTAVDHVGVAVADLDAAVAWYADTFGLVATHTETNDEQGVREAMLRAPGDTGAAVQLLAPLRPDSPIGRFLERNGPGVQQVAYRVTDVDAACAALRAKGLRLLYEAPRRGTAGSRINFVHPRDAGGVLVELVEPAQSGMGHSRGAEAGGTAQPGYDPER